MPHTVAGARVHCGIRFSSDSSPNKSSADAMNCASTDSVVVFTAWPPLFATPAPSAFFLSAASPVLFAPGAAADAAGAGLPWRDGSAETVRSLPCVSTIAAGNALNFASSAAGRLFFASWKSASTAGVRAVVKLHSYYTQ